MKGYEIGHRVTIAGQASSSGYFDIPFTSTDGTNPSITTRRLKILSATYDDATMSVTLTSEKPFTANKHFRYINIVGSGAHTILDATGLGLGMRHSGGRRGDIVLKLAAYQGAGSPTRTSTATGSPFVFRGRGRSSA